MDIFNIKKVKELEKRIASLENNERRQTRTLYETYDEVFLKQKGLIDSLEIRINQLENKIK